MILTLSGSANYWDVLDAVATTIQVDGDMEIYTSGATNVFKYPELSDSQSAKEIINAFEEKQLLQEIVYLYQTLVIRILSLQLDL